MGAEGGRAARSAEKILHIAIVGPRGGGGDGQRAGGGKGSWGMRGEGEGEGEGGERGEGGEGGGCGEGYWEGPHNEALHERSAVAGPPDNGAPRMV